LNSFIQEDEQLVGNGVPHIFTILFYYPTILLSRSCVGFDLAWGGVWSCVGWGLNRYDITIKISILTTLMIVL